MKKEQGTLVKAGKSFQVRLPSKSDSGFSNIPIPAAAKCFANEDAAEGMLVDVDRDEQNRVLKVTIPGKREVRPMLSADQKKSGGGSKASGFNRQGQASGVPKDQPQAARTRSKANPKILGLPFHNPYTYIPFSKAGTTNRSEPTLHSIEEKPGEKEKRFTGLVRIELDTLSPLMTLNPIPISEEKNHKTYEALRIDEDVILPASGLRGSLRTLMTILTGGTLGYLNQQTVLCQGRDLTLGPRSKNSPANTPVKAILARVVQPGNAFRNGVLELGETTLVSLEALQGACGDLDRSRPSPSGLTYLAVTLRENGLIDKSFSNWEEAPWDSWQVKLSGRPINRKGKREGLFRGSKTEITIPIEIWELYHERNKHGVRPELKRGDLVWIEPSNPEIEEITSASQVASIQWARLGRKGQRLELAIQSQFPHVLPDYLQKDSKVDMVTDLFGQASPDRNHPVQPFASRIRFDNIVFKDAKSRLIRETLAPLMPPHPGCVAFSRSNSDPDSISASDSLKGYKVYRTTQETGDAAPWKFVNQGVYDSNGALATSTQPVNKTCDLLPAGCSGRVTISFHALTRSELALLVQACSVPWRLGGGKPLGLGHCQPRIHSILDEFGRNLSIDDWANEVSVVRIQDRVNAWVASQLPVDRLRYPSAVEKNNYKISRGGHVWFMRHSKPRMSSRDAGKIEPGVSPMYMDGQLMKRAKTANESFDSGEPMIAGQILKDFDAERPFEDVLFGYMGFEAEVEGRDRPRRNVVKEYKEFVAPASAAKANSSSLPAKSERNQSSNRQTRTDQKNDRE
jgi:hypothetical protein